MLRSLIHVSVRSFDIPEVGGSAKSDFRNHLSFDFTKLNAVVAQNDMFLYHFTIASSIVSTATSGGGNLLDTIKK
jgi:hypothetical protein